MGILAFLRGGDAGATRIPYSTPVFDFRSAQVGKTNTYYILLVPSATPIVNRNFVRLQEVFSVAGE